MTTKVKECLLLHAWFSSSYIGHGSWNSTQMGFQSPIALFEICSFGIFYDAFLCLLTIFLLYQKLFVKFEMADCWLHSQLPTEQLSFFLNHHPDCVLSTVARVSGQQKNLLLSDYTKQKVPHTCKPSPELYQ